MEREWLARKLEAGTSYEAIAREVGCSPSKVSYWANKHGLTSSHAPRHAGRGGIERPLLVEMISDGLSVRAIADRLDCSPTRVRYWIARMSWRRLPRSHEPSASPPHATVYGCARTTA